MNSEDTFENYGFLSNEIKEIALQNKPKSHIQDIQFLRELVKKSIDMRRNIKLIKDIPTYEGFLFWMRSTEYCQATILLTDIGLQSPAWSTLRTAWEFLLTAAAIWRDPKIADQVARQTKKELGKQASELRKNASNITNEEVMPLIIAAEEAAANVEGGWNMSAAASVAGLVPEYTLYWRGAATAGAHASYFNISGIVKQHVDGSKYINNGPDFDDSDKILTGTLECLNMGITRLEEVVQINRNLV